jgi:6-phosphogluconolactonase
VPSPYGAAVHATDLGTDRLVRYALDPAADAERFRPDGEIAMPPGSGPRHLAYHPTEPVAFALCELDCTLVVLDVDPATGRLQPRTAVSTLPADAGDGSIGAEVRVHPDGRRIYVSNRGHDSIATFAYDAPDETPELLGHVPSGGRTPRHFTIDPTGRLLLAANQDSGTIVSFALDDPSGIPRQIGVVAELSQPVCLTFAEVTP